MSYHFWYSERLEVYSYENYARALECGSVLSLDVPRWNTCRLEIAGEMVSMHYNICSESPDAYVDIADRVYLGQGNIADIRSMKREEVVARVRELGMIAPTVLTRERQ